MSTVKAMDLSTFHLTPKDADILTVYGRDLFGQFSENEYGFLMSVRGGDPEDVQEVIDSLKRVDLSELFCNIYRYVAENDFMFLNFDCDADTDPLFPTSEEAWDNLTQE
jgi:hypothetical protein